MVIRELNPPGRGKLLVRYWWVALAVASATPAKLLAQMRPLRTLVIVVADPDDSRVADVKAAATYWNTVFSREGLPVVFGKVKVTARSFSESLLRAYSNNVVGERRVPDTPNELTRTTGDIVMFLSSGSIVSFAIPIGNSSRRLIGIRTADSSPLNIPNVSRNVIAHELGHALGLDHNRNPEYLMCGRPAICRPDLYRSDTPRFFALTEVEVRRLRRRFAPRPDTR